MAEIRILKVSNALRVFTPAHGPQSLLLAQHNSFAVAKGSTINLCEPTIWCYDHRDMVGMRFTYEGDPEDEYLFILFELISPEDQRAIRILFPDCELIASVH